MFWCNAKMFSGSLFIPFLWNTLTDTYQIWHWCMGVNITVTWHSPYAHEQYHRNALKKNFFKSIKQIKYQLRLKDELIRLWWPVDEGHKIVLNKSLVEKLSLIKILHTMCWLSLRAEFITSCQWLKWFGFQRCGWLPHVSYFLLPWWLWQQTCHQPPPGEVVPTGG